jgi:hypothetical protein
MPGHGIEAATVPVFQANACDYANKTGNELKKRSYIVVDVVMTPLRV